MAEMKFMLDKTNDNDIDVDMHFCPECMVSASLLNNP